MRDLLHILGGHCGNHIGAKFSKPEIFDEPYKGMRSKHGGVENENEVCKTAKTEGIEYKSGKKENQEHPPKRTKTYLVPATRSNPHRHGEVLFYLHHLRCQAATAWGTCGGCSSPGSPYVPLQGRSILHISFLWYCSRPFIFKDWINVATLKKRTPGDFVHLFIRSFVHSTLLEKHWFLSNIL